MQIENSFAVKAEPDRVYEFLLDVNNVVSCVPGAELSEVVDPNTFKGKVRIKVGPVTVSYNGTARITSRDASTRTATLEAEGKETTRFGYRAGDDSDGSGSGRRYVDRDAHHGFHGGRPRCPVRPRDHGGRVASPGRAGRQCIQSKLEAPPCRRDPCVRRWRGSQRGRRTVTGCSRAFAASQPAALDAFALGRAVAKERISRFKVNPKMIGIAFGGLVSLLLLRRLRRSRRRRRAMSD